MLEERSLAEEMPEIIDWLIIGFYFTVNLRRCCTDPLFSHQHSRYVHSQMCLLSYSYNDTVRCFVNQGDVFSYDHQVFGMIRLRLDKVLK